MLQYKSHIGELDSFSISPIPKSYIEQLKGYLEACENMYAFKSLSDYFCLAYLWFHIALVRSGIVLITEKRSLFIEI